MALARPVQSETGLGYRDPWYGNASGIRPPPEQIQQFFSSAAPDFAGWDSVTTGPATFDLMGLQDMTSYYFAVAAIDEASAYDPRFTVGRNVIWLGVDQSIPVETTTWGKIKDGLR